MIEDERNYKQLEAAKLKELAKEYNTKGYEVLIEPTGAELPEPLRNLNYVPDLLAKSGDINVVIEIKSHRTIKHSSHLAKVSEIINGLDGWEFEFVYTNPKKQSDGFIYTYDTYSFSECQNYLDKAKEFLSIREVKNYDDAALMLIWSAVERVLQASYSTYSKKQKISVGNSLIRDAIILGILPRRDQEFLESMFKKRSQVAHGAINYKAPRKDLKKLLNIGFKVLESSQQK